MKVLRSFNFLEEGERESFLLYAYDNKDIQKIFLVRISTEKTEFLCGIIPREVISMQDRNGFIEMISVLPVCDYDSGEMITEIEISEIKKIKILQPTRIKEEEGCECRVR